MPDTPPSEHDLYTRMGLPNNDADEDPEVDRDESEADDGDDDGTPGDPPFWAGEMCDIDIDDV